MIPRGAVVDLTSHSGVGIPSKDYLLQSGGVGELGRWEWEFAKVIGELVGQRKYELVVERAMFLNHVGLL